MSHGAARHTELVHAYLAADYRWELDGRWLNLHLGQAADALRARFPEARHYGLISAWDPHSVPRPEEVNRAADEALQAELLASGRVFRPAFSSATNRTWREPSWIVVDMPVAEFDALAQRYGQLATLYWAADAGVRMRVYAPQPYGFGDDPLVDWVGGSRAMRTNPAA